MENLSRKAFPTIHELLEGYQVPTGHEAVGAGLQLPQEPDLQGWNSDHKIFDDLVDQVRPATVFEVGAWKGRSTLHLARATAALGSEIFSCDTWLGGIDHYLSQLPQDNRLLDRFGHPGLYRQFLRNFIGTDEARRIHPIVQTSVNAARALAHYGMTADLIYIDGSHEYKDVYADLEAFMPLLSASGLIFGDDFRMPGVFAAVLRFAHENNCRMNEIDNNFWILR